MWIRKVLTFFLIERWTQPLYWFNPAWQKASYECATIHYSNVQLQSWGYMVREKTYIQSITPTDNLPTRRQRIAIEWRKNFDGIVNRFGMSGVSYWHVDRWTDGGNYCVACGREAVAPFSQYAWWSQTKNRMCLSVEKRNVNIAQQSWR